MSTQDTGRDYPVVDRVHDEEDEEFDPRDERDDETGAAVLDERADTRDDLDPDLDHDHDTDDDLDTDDAPAHRADSPVDAVPGESDPAGPGDPLPGDGLSADDTRDRRDVDTADEPVLAEETTVVAVEDVPAQDPTLATVPPVTDDTVRGTGPVEAPDADTTTGPPVEALPVPVPGDSTDSADSRDSAVGTAEDFEATWRDLQVTFVDDPATAVRGAADLLERAVAELRQSLEGTDSTEDLRTAFRRYRDVFRNLR